MTQHAELFSPSKASRRLACPGSARMEQGIVEPPSPYAEEGSAAHYLAQLCLEKGENAARYKDRWLVRVGSGFSMLQLGSKRNDGWEINSGMAEAVQAYLDYVRSRPAGGTHLVEQRLTITEDIFGTADHIHAFAFGPLYVDDYKHGVGVAVSPEWNPQALTYALGAVYASPFDHDVVRISIIQPRAREGEPIKTWEISVPELYRWRDEVLLPGIERCKQPDAPLAAGDHCRFCKAKAQCPQIHAEVTAVVPIHAAALPDPKLLNNEQLAGILCKKGMAESWLEEIGALALRKLEAGEIVPGFKLVEGKSNRTWADEGHAAEVLEANLAECAYERKLLSPAKAEKAVKERGLDPKGLAPLIVKSPGKPTLAPASDKRPALPSSAERAFAGIPAAGILG